ncbi:f-box domain-containing protein [Trichonephila inaurata madagascariensis]|uniref:F-box domain-containing protein n=1 Tax=Trichonephila inaurata madagascariensis TaxID=2747483 RepID=A0A8X6XB72_9ARAC|nr:f-box domain-containing protein [Trichonephila inaurata madagascariensis]
MASISNLPPEILLQIFDIYCETVTQRKFIDNVSNVCKQWKELCTDASLWKIFDGTLPFETLLEFSCKGYLRLTEILIISKLTKSPKLKDVKLIYQNMPEVKTVNLSNVAKTECFQMKTPFSFISELVVYCPKLQEIILNDANPCHETVPSHLMFKGFFTLRGSDLISLDFSNSQGYSFLELFNIIGSTCPNLEQLVAYNLRKNYGHPIFNIEHMQNGLPKLKVLCLEYPVQFEYDRSKTTDGFPELTTFTYPCIEEDGSKELIQMKFKKLLMKSPCLKELDIQGCSMISAHSLYSLPTSNLEKLCVSNTELCLYDDFYNALQRWSHSLIELDVSLEQDSAINDSLMSFALSGSLKNLVSLYLYNTAVTMPTVKVIIENCPKLNYLQLESCPDLMEQLRRAHKGEGAIKKLTLDAEII